MCHIIGHKNPNSLDRYGNLLEVACEAAMRTTEPFALVLNRGGIGQYSILKDQVAEVFIKDQFVKSPSYSLYLDMKLHVAVFLLSCSLY